MIVDIHVARSVGGGGSFLAPWQGARAWLFERVSPYSVESAAAAQALIYRRAATSGENPYFVTVPFFLLPIYFPFAVISDPGIARGIWLLFSECAVAATAFLGLRAAALRPPRVLVIGQVLLGVFLYYQIGALVEGAPAIMLGLIYAAMLWAYGSERDELAGALMVLSLFLWEVGGVFLLLFAWRVFHDRRWGVLGGLAMSLTILVAISFLLYPDWVLPFLTAVVATGRAAYGFMTAQILSQLWPASGLRLAQVLSVLMICLMIYEWAAARNADFRRFVWLACLGLSATPLIGFRSEMANLAGLFPVLSIISAGAIARGRTQTWFAAIFLGLAFAIPWLLVTRSSGLLSGGTQGYAYLFYPMLCAIGMYWTRWWFLRPPTTWLDQVHQMSGKP